MIFSIAILAVVLSYTWLIDPIAPNWVTPVPVALVLGLAIWRAIRSGDWGVKPSALLPSLGMAAAFTGAAAIGIYAAGSHLGTWHVRHDRSTDLLLLIPWASASSSRCRLFFCVNHRRRSDGRPAPCWRRYCSRPFTCRIRSSVR